MSKNSKKGYVSKKKKLRNSGFKVPCCWFGYHLQKKPELYKQRLEIYLCNVKIILGQVVETENKLKKCVILTC